MQGVNSYAHWFTIFGLPLAVMVASIGGPFLLKLALQVLRAALR